MTSSAPGLLGESLKGKVALVTGASSGIGAEIARHFASLGCRLALTGRDMEALRNVTDECIQRGLHKDQILMIQAEFELEEDVTRISKETIQKFNQLDVLVNNAAMFKLDTIETFTLQNFDHIFAVNVRAPLHLTKNLAPYLIKTKGTVVNISSICGRTSMTNMMSHSMSQTAMDHMTRCLAEELAPHGVRVNAVNPGATATPIFKRTGMTDEQIAKFFERCKVLHPLGRNGYVDEVSRLVTFLASNDSSFTTGETVGVDGGRHLLIRPVND
ncbi:3-oxoacyl-[acyl-carrier-protein] reductase FabG-like [Lytechinus variegatus]|uniref:3-oxoacyl-[acyl-carrier-protein] reductase FabG-like n=1 Tax=Lytechinus variegatus TaxID=7654 RepID=UPI001BB21F04|nr:3-oxoacyl-[acyl-carrier-protein] reductase FabG-like [Lytechinus variegatus]